MPFLALAGLQLMLCDDTLSDGAMTHRVLAAPRRRRSSFRFPREGPVSCAAAPEARWLRPIPCSDFSYVRCHDVDPARAPSRLWRVARRREADAVRRRPDKVLERDPRVG